MIERTPALHLIQNALFAPPYALVVAWVEHPETLDRMIIKQLEASGLAQQEKQAYLESKMPEDNAVDIANALFTHEEANDNASPNQAIPDAISQLIQQRCQAAVHKFNDSPSEGLMVLLGKGDGSSQDLSLAMASPLAVILNKPTEQKEVWEGWLVGREKNYASDWDFLLNEVTDGVLDPLAGMVQAWNPVSIYLPLVEKTIGELPSKRLDKLRTLANHYKKTLALTGENGIQEKAILQYQTLYTKVAGLIEKKIPQAVPSPFEHWKALFLSQSEVLGQIFTPVSVVSHAMGSEDDPDKQDKHWQLDEDYLFTFNQQKVEGKLLIEIAIKHTNLHEHPFIIEYRENGFLTHHQILSAQSPSTEFICDPDNCDTENPTELIIKDSEGNELHRLNLAPEPKKKPT